MIKKTVTIAAIIVFSLACSTQKEQVQTTPNSKQEVSFSPIVDEGQFIYENNCAKCHDLYNPKDFNAEQWKPILLKMQKEAKISDEEREKIYAYLTK